MAVLNLLPCRPRRRFGGRKSKNAARAELVPDGGPVLAIGPTRQLDRQDMARRKFHRADRKTHPPPMAYPAVRARGGVRGARRGRSGAQGSGRHPRRPPDRRDSSETDPATAAAALGRCVLFVGNDSGLMHCAAAAGTMTVGLFGPSWPHIYGPWGKHATFVSTPESFDELTNYPGYDPKTCGTLMESLTVDSVMETVNGFCTAPQKSRAGAAPRRTRFLKRCTGNYYLPPSPMNGRPARSRASS